MPKSLEYYMSLNYPVEIHRIPEDQGGGYTATIPSLGEYAFVGDGETPQEAYENLQSAKKELFADCIADGVDIPEPEEELDYKAYSGKLMLRLPRELHARLSRAAERNNTSLNQFLVYALGRFEAKLSTVQELESKNAGSRAR